MASKELMGGIGGTVAGYFLLPKRPLLGAVIGYFAGFLVGRQLDKSAAKTAGAIAAGEGAQIEAGTGV